MPRGKAKRMSPIPPPLQTGAALPLQGDAQRLLGIVRGLARELRPHAPEVDHLQLDHSLERDFGLDSLARAELLARIERELGARLDEQALIGAETPRDLLRLIGLAAADRLGPPTRIAGKRAARSRQHAAVRPAARHHVHLDRTAGLACGEPR